MKCSMTDLLEKSVINASNGNKIGQLCDIELDTGSACLSALIVAVRNKSTPFIAKCEKVRIDWCNIRIIGKDAILVDCAEELCFINEQKNFLDKLWN